jgi:protein-L-isoaspartate(D-aspartate) O-methyltransferase
MRIEDRRQIYAEEIQALANIQSAAIIQAFATVPREHFLGPGPWMLDSPDMVTGRPNYRPSPDADPKHLYHNMPVALDPARNLNNGHPATLAKWMDALDLKPGGRVFHLGCGVGYYTAILAEVVGDSGNVLAAEVDADLAARAQANLAPRKNVQVVAGDGGALDPGPCDVVFVNAGVTHPLPVWLDRLNPGGRMLAPLTFDIGNTVPGLVKGAPLLVKREANGYRAAFIGFVMIYAAAGLRDPEMNVPLMKAFSSMTTQKVQSLRRDQHPQDDTCWLHAGGFCLSARAV